MRCPTGHNRAAAAAAAAGAIVSCVFGLSSLLTSDTAHAQEPASGAAAASIAAQNDQTEPPDDLWSLVSQLLDGDWRVPLVLLGGLVIALLRPPRGVLAAMISQKLVARVKESMLTRPLLRPSSRITVTEIDTTRMIPLEPTVNRRGRVGPLRSILLLLLRPGSPKPSFVLDTWRMTHGQTLQPTRGGLLAGGYRLLLSLADTESVGHLAASIGSSLVRSSKTLLICTPENYLSPYGRVHCCTVDWRRVKRARDRSDTLVAYSADELHLAVANYRVLPRSAVPNGIWLISLDRHGGGPEEVPAMSEQPVAVHTLRSPIAAARLMGRNFKRICCSSFSRICHSFRCRDRALRKVRDPSRHDRAILHWVAVYISAPILLLLLPWTSSKMVELMLKLPNDRFIIAVLVIAYLPALHLFFQLSKYLRHEWLAPTTWRATTTRCLTDGAFVRNGLYRYLHKSERRRADADLNHFIKMAAPRSLRAPVGAGEGGEDAGAGEGGEDAGAGEGGEDLERGD